MKAKRKYLRKRRIRSLRRRLPKSSQVVKESDQTAKFPRMGLQLRNGSVLNL